jgi:hypothetical protein
MASSYKFGGGEERKIFGPLPEGDYNFAVTECPEPYQKETGNWVLNVRLNILPNGETVFGVVWSGTDKNGDARDGIGEFLMAVNRAPAIGQEPAWRKVVGAKGKCRLKIEIAQQGALAGKEVNKVAFFHRPKELETDYHKAQTKVAAKVNPNPEEDPDEIPF